VSALVANRCCADQVARVQRKDVADQNRNPEPVKLSKRDPGYRKEQYQNDRDWHKHNDACSHAEQKAYHDQDYRDKQLRLPDIERYTTRRFHADIPAHFLSRRSDDSLCSVKQA
jgi:hypothetical protein